MALKQLKSTVMLLVPQSINYSEGASSVSSCYGQYYQLIQYHRHLVLLNLQPDSQQKICVLLTLVQEGSTQVDTGASTKVIKQVKHNNISKAFYVPVY